MFNEKSLYILLDVEFKYFIIYTTMNINKYIINVSM